MTFYYPYIGSKRLDLKHFSDFIHLDNIETIVEPFCGSSAFSYHCFSKLDKEDLNYHINDTDKNLINFINQVREKKGIKYFVDGVNKFGRPKDKEEYKRLCADKKFGFFYSQKIYGIRRNLMPTESRRCTVAYDKIQHFDDFYLKKNLKITCLDYSDIFKKYINDEKAFIFLDPPYLSSFNAYYIDYDNVGHDKQSKVITDNTKVFIDILNFIKNCKCRVLLIINKNAMTDHIYRNYIVGEYDKIYQLTKKKTKHLIITNN